MRFTTYERQLRRAYDNSNLYVYLPLELGIVMIDLSKQYRRGLTVSQVIKALNSEFMKTTWSYETIQIALNETTPKGKQYD